MNHVVLQIARRGECMIPFPSLALPSLPRSFSRVQAATVAVAMCDKGRYACKVGGKGCEDRSEKGNRLTPIAK